MNLEELVALEIARARDRELEKRLEIARLLREGRLARPSQLDLALATLGDALIELGTRLRRRSGCPDPRRLGYSYLWSTGLKG